MTSLGLLFQRWGTDKDKNGFSGLYECLFRRNRQQIATLLEIGIGTMLPNVPSSMLGFAMGHYEPGGSLKAWREYFPNAEIYGIDVQPDTHLVNEEKISTFLCDSTDPSQVQQMLRSSKHKEFDIIIDDGSHLPEHQIATLKNFFPLLTTDGIYVIEDLVDDWFFKSTDPIREICGNSPLFFFKGPGNCPVERTRAIVLLRTAVLSTTGTEIKKSR